MQTKGSIALGEIAALASHLDLACSRCERKGRYRLPWLVEVFGADFLVTNLGAELSDCPHRAEVIHSARCDVYFPGLRVLMYGADQPPKS